MLTILLTHHARFAIHTAKVFDSVDSYTALNNAIRLYGTSVSKNTNSDEYKRAVGAAYEVFCEYFYRRYGSDVMVNVLDLQDTSADPYQPGYDFRYTNISGNPGRIQCKWKSDSTYKFTRKDLGTFSSVLREEEIHSNESLLFTNLRHNTNEEHGSVFHFTWDDGARKWLVIANVEFVYVVKKYFEYKGWDIGNIYFVTPCDYKKKVVDKIGILEYNIGKYNYETLDVCGDFKDMKFDVIVGNPPYSIPIQGEGRIAGTKTRLYATFFNTVFKNADNYAVVLPSNWIGRETDSVRSAVFDDLDVKWIYDTSHYFNSLISGTPTCAVIKQKDYHNQIKLTIQENTTYAIPASMFTSLSIGPYLPIFNKLNIRQRMSDMWRRNVNTGLTRSSPLITTNVTNFPVVLVTGPRGQPTTCAFSTTHVNQRDIDKIKVIMNTNASINDIGAIKILDSGYYTTDSIVFFSTDTVQEAENIRAYLESNLVKFIVKTIRNSHGNSKAFFSKVPRLPFDKKWTDQELYQHFNLTQEEINLIEGTIK